MDKSEVVPDGPFAPNLLNTVIFLFDFWVSSVNFVINYEGEPFMKSIRENKGLYRSVMLTFAIIMAGLLGVEIVTENMALVPMPSGLYVVLVPGIFVVDLLLCLLIKSGCNYYKYKTTILS